MDGYWCWLINKTIAILLSVALLSDVSIVVNLYLTIYFIKWLVDPNAEKMDWVYLSHSFGINSAIHISIKKLFYI